MHRVKKALPLPEGQALLGGTLDGDQIHRDEPRALSAGRTGQGQPQLRLHEGRLPAKSNVGRAEGLQPGADVFPRHRNTGVQLQAVLLPQPRDGAPDHVLNHVVPLKKRTLLVQGSRASQIPNEDQETIHKEERNPRAQGHHHKKANHAARLGPARLLQRCRHDFTLLRQGCVPAARPALRHFD